MIPDSARAPLAGTLTAAAVGQTMMVGGSLLARAVVDLPSQQLDTTSLATFYGLFTAGACASWWASRRVRSGGSPRSEAAVPATAPAAEEIAPAMVPAMPEVEEVPLPTDKFIRRLQQVSDGLSIVIAHPLVQDEETGEYTSFRVRATKAGLFAKENVRLSIYTQLTQSVGGYWNFATDAQSDTMTFTRKAGFPSVITPPIPHYIPQDVKDALSLYPNFRMRLGVTSSDDVLEIDLAKLPHCLFIGGTGSGKSVFARAVIEHFRVAGWMLFLGDGKGTDYEGLHRQRGIVAISQRTADHVRMVRMVADELRGRQKDAKLRKRAGHQDPFQRPPLLLLLDEYATMLANVKAEYGHEAFEQDLLFITRVGREFKVHLILSTQEAYRSTIPGALLGNLGLRVSLGPPEDKTIAEVFPEALQKDAKRIGGTIKKSDRGRGLALMSDEEGNNSAIEFQSYYAYSPGESKPPANPEVAEQWRRYKSEASDRIPVLYPRLWFKVEGPDYGDVLDDLYDLPVVRLSGRDGTTRPSMMKYDPLCDEYLGGGDAADGSVIHSLDELEDDDDDFDERAPVNGLPEAEVDLHKSEVDLGKGQPAVIEHDEEDASADIAGTEGFSMTSDDFEYPAAPEQAADPEPDIVASPTRQPIAPRRQQGF
ncbi:FtsK/SpoIIIE domain-containing protein [Rhodococcus qingshengii]|uniref:FtsK/SpoIIIE domain-containing protein n=1 Tax=Rhodococcus qingshengii TaxID=334542 RepID=A0AAW6LMX4_RHOSG|nr:FtsK/SpoIIIE domain-containing protein [Rhodococcus qingshengii]MDE8647546.1 FtsK/SpoIIIE domain-containing protein [Rhodococcus qingshengii]